MEHSLAEKLKDEEKPKYQGFLLWFSWFKNKPNHQGGRCIRAKNSSKIKDSGNNQVHKNHMWKCKGQRARSNHYISPLLFTIAESHYAEVSLNWDKTDAKWRWKVGEPCQDSIIKVKDAGNIRETTRILELQDKDGNSHSGNKNTETKILNEKVR